MFPFVSKKEHANILLRHDCDSKSMLDGLGVGVRFGEFLGSAFEVCAGFLGVGLELFVEAVQTLVVVEISVLDLGVLLPRVGCRTAHDDLDTVVLNRAGEVLGQSALSDEFSHGLFYLRAQCVNAFLTLVLAQHGAEHLVDDRKINCFHNASSFGGLRLPQCEVFCSERRCKSIACFVLFKGHYVPKMSLLSPKCAFQQKRTKKAAREGRFGD